MLSVLGEVSVSSSGALLLEFLRLSCTCAQRWFSPVLWHCVDSIILPGHPCLFQDVSDILMGEGIKLYSNDCGTAVSSATPTSTQIFQLLLYPEPSMYVI